MKTKMNLRVLAVATGLLACLVPAPGFGQTEDHSKMGKMSGTKMSGNKMTHEEMVAKMDKMSTDDKAAMIDKMPSKDKMAAMKMSGHEGTSMSAQEKADMFDKMPMDKKMSMMSGGSMMHKGGKMGMGKMGKMDK